MLRSEQLAARAEGLCLERRIAFAAAACDRARNVFALWHGATPVATFDDALASLWDDLERRDTAAISGIFRPLMNVPEANCNDTLSRDWMAWLALAVFEFASAFPGARRPLETLAQCSAFCLSMMAELDLRRGWEGAPRGGPFATAEWIAQEKCLAILGLDPGNPSIPVSDLVAAGDELRTLMAGAAGWVSPR